MFKSLGLIFYMDLLNNSLVGEKERDVKAKVVLAVFFIECLLLYTSVMNEWWMGNLELSRKSH